MLSLAAGVMFTADPSAEVEVHVGSVNDNELSYKQVSIKIGSLNLTLMLGEDQLRRIVNECLRKEIVPGRGRNRGHNSRMSDHDNTSEVPCGSEIDGGDDGAVDGIPGG